MNLDQQGMIIMNTTYGTYESCDDLVYCIVKASVKALPCPPGDLFTEKKDLMNEVPLLYRVVCHAPRSGGAPSSGVVLAAATAAASAPAAAVEARNSSTPLASTERRRRSGAGAGRGSGANNIPVGRPPHLIKVRVIETSRRVLARGLRGISCHLPGDDMLGLVSQYDV